ncbi:MAG: ribosome maturation factor RimM [Dictyoglomus sp.]|nr:ribosome maturation factor RimM [Dictyoglomus sp.]MCX7941602.1 ribosome maturation factor RimM [Dictyoglomaceae bacterium]MDW8187779.1 ribosome maturation factor RimM [Dictyoglomus sp.]
MNERRLIRIAKLGEPFGIRGGIKIYSFYDYIFKLRKGQKLYIAEGDTEYIKKEVTLENIHFHGKGYVVYFEEFKDRNSIEKLRGNWLLLEEDLLLELPEGSFYFFQILGLSVYDLNGEFLGTVREIIQTGSNDVFVVENQGKELLLPFIKHVIKEVNIKEKKIVVELIQEL